MRYLLAALLAASMIGCEKEPEGPLSVKCDPVVPPEDALELCLLETCCYDYEEGPRQCFVESDRGGRWICPASGCTDEQLAGPMEVCHYEPYTGSGGDNL